MPGADPVPQRHRRDGQPAGAQKRRGAPDHRAAGAELRYLPPYSPDLNPIEQGFSKLKAHLRKAQERSIDALWQRIGQLLDLFRPSECANFFANSGYARV